MGYEEKKPVTSATNAGESETVFQHAQRLTQPLEPDSGSQSGPPCIVVPHGWTVKELPWTDQVPKRIIQTVELTDHESFCLYVKEFKDPSSRIFAELSDAGGTFTAVLDYHHEEPSLCTHRARFTPAPTVNWKRWMAANGKQMTQTEFAIFLENNTADVVTPAGADLLQIINEFEVEGALSFQKIQRLQNGTVKFSFQNSQHARAGDLSVPELFELRFPLFEGEPATQLTARLRYRLGQGGELKVWFELVNPHIQVRGGLAGLVDRLAVGCGIEPLMGKMA